MRLKSIIFALSPMFLKVRIFKKYRINNQCGYGAEFSTYLNKAFQTFLTESERNDSSLINNLTLDIIECWLRYRALPYEYFLFDFRRNTTNSYRSSFLTDMDRLPTLASLPGSADFFECINDKYNFYLKLHDLFKRKAFNLNSDTIFCEFMQFVLNTKHIFAKKNTGSKGFGAISRTVCSEDEALALYNDLLSNGDSWIVEEKIQQSAIMSQWCSTCVNTVRIPSFLTTNGIYILDPFFRTGHEGSIVDNAGQGGVFAVVDSNTGILITDGIDEKGNCFYEHPDSHLIFKGWQIPFWDELLEAVEKAHHMIPNQKYIGWDFALTDDGWVLIEGNWGQMLGQYATKKGIKQQFYHYLYL